MIRHVAIEDAEVTAGGREAFQDGAFYEWEYRRRRDDVRFYRTLVEEKGGPVLDLGCGTGRVLVPLVRDGHEVMGVDLSARMLRYTRARLARLDRSARARASLLEGDMTTVRVPRRFSIALCAFHGLQHVPTARALEAFLRRCRGALLPGGWLIFDLFVPDETFLARDPQREFDRTVFRHPTTGQRLQYTLRQRHDRRRRLLLMEMCYRTLTAGGTAREPPRVVRLCHRLWRAPEIDRHLARAGFRTLARYADFSGTPWSEEEEKTTEQLIVIARVEPSGARRPAR